MLCSSDFELYSRWVPLAYVCETDQMAQFHTILTLIFNSDDLNLATLNSGAFLI